MTCPCKDCSKRTSDCHGKCAGYQEWSKLNEEARNKRNEASLSAYLSRPKYRKRRRIR